MNSFSKTHLENLRLFHKELLNIKHLLEINNVDKLVDFPLDELAIDFFSTNDGDRLENRLIIDLNDLYEILNSLLIDTSPSRLSKLEQRI